MCVCVCDYTNSDVKTSKISKKIYNQRMSYWNNLKITRKTIIYIYIYINVVEEKKITEEEFITLPDFKKNIGVCTTFIVFMINLANLEINYQRLSLSLSWTC